MSDLDDLLPGEPEPCPHCGGSGGGDFPMHCQHCGATGLAPLPPDDTDRTEDPS